MESLHVREVVYFCNGKVKTLGIDKHLNFLPAFNLFTVPAKIPYLQKYSIDFRNICFRLKIFRVGIWVESFRCAGILLLAMARRKLWASTTFEILPLSTCTLWQAKILYLERYSIDFRNLRLSSKMLRVGIRVESFRCAGILLLQWQGENVCASKTFEILPLSTCSMCQQKSHISKSIQPIFEIFASARRCWGWAFGWKVLACAGSLLLQWQCENFGHFENIWIFADFRPVHCASKNPISPNVFNTIFEIFASARKSLGWAFVWKVSGALVFYFCNGKAKTLRIDNIWNSAAFNLYSVHCASENAYISNGIQPIFEIFASARRC